MPADSDAPSDAPYCLVHRATPDSCRRPRADRHGRSEDLHVILTTAAPSSPDRRRSEPGEQSRGGFGFVRTHREQDGDRPRAEQSLDRRRVGHAHRYRNVLYTHLAVPVMNKFASPNGS